MISFLGAAAYVVVPRDVLYNGFAWVPVRGAVAHAPDRQSCVFGIFLTLIQETFAVEKWNRRLLFYDGHGRGAGTSHLGPFPGPTQRRAQDDVRGGAVLS